MNKPFQKAAPPKSYAEGPRLSRAIQALPFEDRERLMQCCRAHSESPTILAVQRRGASILFELNDGQRIFDFGELSRAQLALSALTDFLRAGGAAVKVLMPAPPASGAAES